MQRKINTFEKLLLVMGLGVVLFGFYLIIWTDKAGDVSAWIKLLTVFVWFILITQLIVGAINENMKEELAHINKEHLTEIRILKKLLQDQNEEIALLRKELQR